MNNLQFDMQGLNPFQKLAGLGSLALDIKSFHTFGCPVYVLDGRLQSGLSMIPKWDLRARMGIYVGRSPAHASSVGLVLNPRTGHVSPQFHVIYDDDFTTVPYLRTGKVPEHWAELVKASEEFSVSDNQKDTWNSLERSTSEEGKFSIENKLVTMNGASPQHSISGPTELDRNEGIVNPHHNMFEPTAEHLQSIPEDSRLDGNRGNFITQSQETHFNGNGLANFDNSDVTNHI